MPAMSEYVGRTNLDDLEDHIPRILTALGGVNVREVKTVPLGLGGGDPLTEDDVRAYLSTEGYDGLTDGELVED